PGTGTSECPGELRIREHDLSGGRTEQGPLPVEHRPRHRRKPERHARSQLRLDGGRYAELVQIHGRDLARLEPRDARENLEHTLRARQDLEPRAAARSPAVLLEIAERNSAPVAEQARESDLRADPAARLLGHQIGAEPRQYREPER